MAGAAGTAPARDAATPANERRVLVVQYAGDYRDTWRRLERGGSETYFAQAYSDREIARLATAPHRVTVLVGLSDKAYEEELAPGLVAVGLGASGTVPEAAIVDYARAFRPTHLLLRAPMRGVLAWACEHGVSTLVTLADSFGPGLRAWWATRSLVRLLNRPCVEWVANHGVAATRALVGRGVDPGKAIPWDWPHPHSPSQWSPKTLAATSRSRQLLYVGSRIAAKGVGDVIEAVAILAGRGIDARLDVIGDGDDFAPLVRSLKIEERVSFLGRLANDKIIGAMRAADAVVVPSRHEYPEGFPLTVYEALCSRTPLIASDHPMLMQKLTADRSAVVFEAGHAGKLADAAARLFASPGLYAALSLAAPATWDLLQVPMKWGALVHAWVQRAPEQRAWLQSHTWRDRAYV